MLKSVLRQVLLVAYLCKYHGFNKWGYGEMFSVLLLLSKTENDINYNKKYLISCFYCNFLIILLRIVLKSIIIKKIINDIEYIVMLASIIILIIKVSNEKGLQNIKKLRMTSR